MTTTRLKQPSKEEAEPFLVDDLALNCLARVSRSDHAALSIASKSLRSLVASPDLYKIRSLMGLTETYIYACLLIPPHPYPQWHILRRNRTSSTLIPIPTPPQPKAASVVVLDWGIYVLGGYIKEERTSDVWLLDCRTHTWSKLPSMGVARAHAAAGVVDGKIYVFGGHSESNSGEVFDPKTQTWDELPPMLTEFIRYSSYIRNSFVRDQKVYAVDMKDDVLYYWPSRGEWGRGIRGRWHGNLKRLRVVDGLMICIDYYGRLHWCESDEGMMNPKEVKGLEYFILNAKLINSGGRLVLFWDALQGDRLDILCAEISLDRGTELRGNIEWSNVVLNVDPTSYRFLYSVSITL